MPKDDWIEFKNFCKMVKCPAFVVADFETILQKPLSTGKTQKTAKHVPCAFALKVVSHFEEWDMPVESYRGPDAAQVLILRLHEIFESFQPLIHANEEMKGLTPEKHGRT